MVKVCKKNFPVGSYSGQKSPGFYMDKLLKRNLDVFCEKIVDDMQFVILITGTGNVRNGKSTLAKQIGYYMTKKINKLHNKHNKFTIENIIFKGDDLINTALKLPKYSIDVLDEGDDLVEMHWSLLARRLRRFFRKCGQLNQILILLIPDFFELNDNFALVRSNCLINVRFGKRFKRGLYKFYNRRGKKQLYMRGKKWKNYKGWKPNFNGAFNDAQTINEEIYEKKKLLDLKDDQLEPSQRKANILKEHCIKIIENNKKNKLNLNKKQLGLLLGTSPRSMGRYEGGGNPKGGGK